MASQWNMPYTVDDDLAVTQSKHLALVWMLDEIQSFMCVKCSIHFLILQLSLTLFHPDIRMLLSHMSHCLHTVVVSLCVTRLTGLSFHSFSTPLTLALNPAVGSSSSLPRLPSCAQRWSELANLSELNAKSTEHQQWELPSLVLYLSIFLSINILSNKCVHRHSVKMCWFWYLPLCCSKHLT